jgi:hypothetical protein
VSDQIRCICGALLIDYYGTLCPMCRQPLDVTSAEPQYVTLPEVGDGA